MKSLDVLIVEMVTIGYDLKFGKDRFKVAIHGPSYGDRENPHMHIYLENDKIPFNKFNLSKRYKKWNKTNRNKCSWDGYFKLKEDFEDWLFSKSSKRGDFKDNLDAIIYFYNEENHNKTLWDYIEEHGLKILDKYKHYKE